MTSITAYGAGSQATARADASYRSLKASLDTQQKALTTGKIASTYGGLAQTGVSATLAARSMLAGMAQTQSGLTDATLRVKLASQGLQQIDKLSSSLSSSLPTSAQAWPVGQTSATVSAQEGLQQTIDILNTQVNGRYLFSGTDQLTEPVADADTILNGSGGQAGLKTLIGERREADAGTDGLGRLAVTGSGTTVTLAETAANLPFGLKVQGASATGAGLTATASTATSPASAALGVSTQPLSGDAVTVTLGLPDGTTATITLTARSADANPATPAADGSSADFAIGATPADTAANLQAALGTALGTFGETALASASTMKAASDFFAGSADAPPARVAGPPFATATATVAGTPDNTVIWYAGENGPGDPRATSPVATGTGSTIGIGFRANEGSFRSVLASFAALAADSFTGSDATTQARYTALANRVATAPDTTALRQGEADLSIANSAIGSASDRLSQAQTIAQNTVDGVENADPSTVASELLATQTRLQASYQTTAAIAKLSLVDYI